MARESKLVLLKEGPSPSALPKPLGGRTVTGDIPASVLVQKHELLARFLFTPLPILWMFTGFNDWS